MGKLKTFFHVLIKSHTSPAYYKELLPVKFSFSLKYFYLYFLLYALIGTIYVGFMVAPPVSKFLSALPAKVQSLYPDELIVTIKNGEVSTNVEEPFSIPLSRFEELFTPDSVLGTNTVSPENLIVIDTEGQVDDFATYRTAVLITKKNVVIMDNDGTRLYPLDGSMNYTLTKAEVNSGINQVSPFLDYIIPGMIIFTFLGLFLFVPSGHLLYLLFFALLFWLLAKITKINLTYKGCYKLGLHLVTIHATVFGLLFMLNIHPNFPFLRTILLLVFGFFALKTISTPPSTSQPAA